MPTIETYLFFGGNCEEALNFYRDTLGARIDFMLRYNESPEPVPADKLPAGFENKVRHCTFSIGDTTLMASDGNEVGPHFNGFSLSLNLKTIAEAEKIFSALSSDGGIITMPLTQTFWAPRFGMLTDKFGLPWMINAKAE